jgi:DNA mismatch repair ATPase MutS
MKAFLLYRDQDFDLQQPLPPNEQALTQDLELNTLFNAMAQGDKFLFDVARRVILTGTDKLDTIRYRQEILKDCLKNPTVIRQLYQIPIDSIERRQRHWLGVFSSYPVGILSGANDFMEMFLELLHRLQNIAEENAEKFESDGFRKFFAMIKKELSEEYLASIQEHLDELRFTEGVLISAELGKGNEGVHYILRKPPDKLNWTKRIFSPKHPIYSFTLHPRDDAGARAIGDLKDRGINQVANALAQSTDHIDSYLKMLRVELAFYIGCLNLADQLAGMGESISFPEPAESNERMHSFRGLYDVSLALTMKQKTISNNVDANAKDLVIITGANQGGKSVFLRSIGIAQLMMQSGMFVPADDFTANTCKSLFTHYKRKEDTTMKSGKLDEELSRMSDIVDHLSPDSMVLFNESFSATNEREGSEIARQITTALLEEHVKVFYVTHQFEFANGFYEKHIGNAIFLRADRKTGGMRTYKLIEGKPLQTSFGEDVYQKIFKPEPVETNRLPEKAESRGENKNV